MYIRAGYATSLTSLSEWWGDHTSFALKARCSLRSHSNQDVKALDLARSQLPNHIAVVMDGNARWAQRAGKPITAGHQAGVGALRRAIDCCCEWGIPALTVYAFSAENWQRSAPEVAFLLRLIDSVLQDEVQALADRGIALRFLGDLETLPAGLQKRVRWAERETASGDSLNLTVALSYSGRQDILNAATKLAKLIEAGSLGSDEITEDMFAAQLSTGRLPMGLREPDLLIRTSGEQRLSNFLLWQIAYSELVFSPTLWPDFGEADLRSAILEYAKRTRRFGRRR